MRFHCHKCNKVLTQDLYPASAWNKKIITEEYEIGIDTGETEFVDEIVYELPFGTYQTKHYLQKRKGHTRVSYLDPNFFDNNYATPYRLKNLRTALVGETSFVEHVIPPYRTGCGCCNWSMGDDLYCQCDTLLGFMYLDCYEDKVVELIEGNCKRTYK